MPIHDWTRVRANRFHDFRQSWTIAIRNALNAGRLPPGYFAMVEQNSGGPERDVVTIRRTPTAPTPGRRVFDRQSPKPRFVIPSETVSDARNSDHITVRDPDEEVVAVIEIVSPGDKNRRKAIRAFARTAVELLKAGVHLLIVDLFPPSRRHDPQGINKVIWDRLDEHSYELPPEVRLTVVAYVASTVPVAYIEPIAVGDALPDMPIYLTADRYVPCPLEATYQTAWEQFPAPLKGPLELPTS